MTYARLPGSWLHSPIYEDITDRTWRIHTNALMWSHSQASDGWIPTRTLRLLHPEGATPADAAALVDAQLWEVVADGWQVSDWRESQEVQP